MADKDSATKSFNAALVQMCSGRDVDRNMEDASNLIREAAALGAVYIQTPEMTTILELELEPLLASTTTEQDSDALRHFQDLARDLQVWLHIGSMAVRVGGDEKLANRSFLIAPDGTIATRYDKLHMFDVDLPDGESYSESDKYKPGQKAVIADLPWGKMGLTICYDLRFPALHRALAQAGAVMLASPAAFTHTTGKAHWHTLIKARAIEAQCFVFAANQGGMHEIGRRTYGHSLIVSPWGEILAEGGEEPGVITARIDLSQVEEVRNRVPSLKHDRNFDVMTIDRT